MITALFGGSFNPPHMAHTLAVAMVLARFDVARVLVIPTFSHPFAKQLAPFDDRVEMAKRAMGFLPKVEISRVEEELGGESRTVRTLEHLHALHPDWQMRFVMGGDLVNESSKWYRFDRIQELAPPIVLGRAGHATQPSAPEAMLPRLSSTEVRTLCAEEKWQELEPLLPRAVLEYVRTKSLYQ